MSKRETLVHSANASTYFAYFRLEEIFIFHLIFLYSRDIMNIIMGSPLLKGFPKNNKENTYEKIFSGLHHRIDDLDA